MLLYRLSGSKFCYGVNTDTLYLIFKVFAIENKFFYNYIAISFSEAQILRPPAVQRELFVPESLKGIAAQEFFVKFI